MGPEPARWFNGQRFLYHKPEFGPKWSSGVHMDAKACMHKNTQIIIHDLLMITAVGAVLPSPTSKV